MTDSQFLVSAPANMLVAAGVLPLLYNSARSDYYLTFLTVWPSHHHNYLPTLVDAGFGAEILVTGLFQ